MEFILFYNKEIFTTARDARAQVAAIIKKNFMDGKIKIYTTAHDTWVQVATMPQINRIPANIHDITSTHEKNTGKIR